MAYDLESVLRTVFIGRARELDELRSELERGARLVTLLGAPGVGKTRLALELSARKLRSEPGSVWVADVARATDAAAINRAVAEALGASIDPPSSAAIASELGRRGRVLVVLDGFEELVECAAATLGVWLARAPELSLLVTSRRRLGRSGEILFELGPLTEPDAQTLFLDRARGARPGFAPNRAELAMIGELVRKLEGLPLAIELAASRLRVLTLSALLERAGDLPGLLVDEGRRGRGASLDAALERSWTSLEPWQQRALAACSEFEAEFALAEAERKLELAAGARSVLDILQSLRDCSLLTITSSGEYRVSNCVRQWVRKRLGRIESAKSLPDDALALAADARRFRAPGADWVALPRESPLRLILLRLVERHTTRPGEPIPIEDLVRAGWPGERILPDAARNRGYMALSRLRKLGLGSLIERSEDGYFLTRDLRIVQLTE